MTVLPGEFGLIATRGLGRTEVAVRGELDAYTAPRLRTELARLVDGGEVALVLDLRDVTFVDSFGLGVFVGAAKKARSKGGDLVMALPTESVHKLLEMTGVSKIIATVDTLSAGPFVRQE